MIMCKVIIVGFDFSSYCDCFMKWNKVIEVMYVQCMEVGKDKCLFVYYEQLVLYFRCLFKFIFDFFGIVWSDVVFYYEDFIGKLGGVFLFKIEWFMDQVIKFVNLEVFFKWIGYIFGDVVWDMVQIVFMLVQFGYDFYVNFFNYGNFDFIVVNNIQWVLKGDYKILVNLKGYFQVNQNSIFFYLGSL